MNESQMTELLRKEFFARLDQKTGWGKNQVKKEFEQSVNKVLFKTVKETDRDDDDTDGNYYYNNCPF